MLSLASYFSGKELAAIDKLAKTKDLSRLQVIRQALRQYQLIEHLIETGIITRTEFETLIAKGLLQWEGLV